MIGRGGRKRNDLNDIKLSPQLIARLATTYKQTHKYKLPRYVTPGAYELVHTHKTGFATQVIIHNIVSDLYVIH